MQLTQATDSITRGTRVGGHAAFVFTLFGQIAGSIFAIGALADIVGELDDTVSAQGCKNAQL